MIDYKPNAEIIWLEDVKAIQVRWLKLHMKMELFQEIAGKAFEVMSKNNGSIWIADMYDSQGVFPKDIMEYISADETTQASISIGLKWALTVMPKASGLASLSTKSWNKSVDDLNAFVVEQFPDLDTCKEWILKQQSILRSEAS